MVNLCSMASLGNPSGFVLQQEQGMSRVIKDCVPLLPSPGVGRDATRSGFLNLKLHQSEGPWRPISGMLESNKFVKIYSTATRPVLIDVQVRDDCPSSVLFSYGIAENCTRHDKVLQYLMSGSSKVEAEGLDLSLLSELTGLQIVTNDDHQLQFVPLNYPSSEIYAKKPLVDYIGDLALGSIITVHPDGRILLTGTGSEMKDLLSLVAEFYTSNDSTMCRKQSLLVLHFDRPDGDEAQALANAPSPKLQALTVAPSKSPEKVKLKPSHKKRSSGKQGKDRDLYKKNSFHACESLLSLMVDRRQNRKTAINSLKTSGPELPQLLTQFSAGIAGTGLAVVFSVISRVAWGRVPFCASKLFNTGFGFGLVWLAWAVNGLRDTIVCISKNSNKTGLKEEDKIRKVDSRVKEIYFRAATLLAFAILKLG